MGGPTTQTTSVCVCNCMIFSRAYFCLLSYFNKNSFSDLAGTRIYLASSSCLIRLRFEITRKTIHFWELTKNETYPLIALSAPQELYVTVRHGSTPEAQETQETQSHCESFHSNGKIWRIYRIKRKSITEGSMNHVTL